MNKLSHRDYLITKAGRGRLSKDLSDSEAEAYASLTSENAILLHAKVQGLDVLIGAHEKPQIH